MGSLQTFSEQGSLEANTNAHVLELSENEDVAYFVVLGQKISNRKDFNDNNLLRY